MPWELMRFVCTHESHEIAEEVPREEGDRPWQSLLPLGSRAPPNLKHVAESHESQSLRKQNDE